MRFASSTNRPIGDWYFCYERGAICLLRKTDLLTIESCKVVCQTGMALNHNNVKSHRREGR